MPTRYLRPGVRDSDAINALSPLAECLFYRLLVTVDDFGRTDARPAMIKAACFPIKDSVDAGQCVELLNELSAKGLVALYTVDGKPYLQMRKWENVPRAKESKFPSPESGCIQVHAGVCKPHTDLPVTGTVTGTVISDGDKSPSSSPTTATEPAAPAAPAPRTPDCPFEDIVAAYNEILPELPRVIAINDDRKRAMRKAWKFVLTSKRSDGQRRAETPEQALDWLREFFRRARGNDFVMGRTPRGPGHEGWEADLDYLLTDRGMTRVLEKTNVATA